MQSIDDFMRALFAARLAEEKRIQSERLAYRKEYFTSDCRWDSRSGTLAMIETETIIDIDESDLEPKVITSFEVPFYKSGSKKHRRRYHLKTVTDGWRVRLVESECPVCHGQGDESCISCKGKHWK